MGGAGEGRAGGKGAEDAAVLNHEVYTGVGHRGNTSYVFGKCRCGAVLNGRQEIDLHRELWGLR